MSSLDRAVLLALARCRVLSFDQLRRMMFPQLSPQRVGQRLQALAAAGWLRVWEDVSRIGGRPRYALPTARALVLAHETLLASSAGTPAERLAALLFRAPARDCDGRGFINARGGGLGRGKARPEKSPYPM